MTYELNVDRFYAQLGVFFSYFRYFTWYRDEVWIELNLMTQDFHVDRCVWPLFSILVISFDRGIELGSNWNSWPMNLMLTDFTPNWALFLFSLFHNDRGIKLESNWNSWPMNLMLTDFTPNWALFLFSLFHIIDVWNMDEIESYDLRILCWQILRPIGCFFYFHYFTY